MADTNKDETRNQRVNEDVSEMFFQETQPI